MQQHQSRSASMLAGLMSLVLASALAFPAVAFAEPTASEKQAEAQAVLASLDAMQEKLDRASNEYHEALEAQKAAEASSEEAQARIDEASGRITELQKRLGMRASSMYRSGSSSFLDFLLGASSFQEFATNWDLLTLVNNSDAALVNETKSLRAEVEEQKATFVEQQRIAAEKAAEAKRVQDEAASTVASMQATYDSLSAEAAELVEKERAAQEAAHAATVQRALEEAQQQEGGQESAENSNNAGSSDNDSDNSNSHTNKPSNRPSEPSYNPGTGNVIVDTAYSKLGKWYEWAGSGPETFDCSGLVQFCYAAAGISVAHSTTAFMNYTRVKNPQLGDICTNDHHAGIYIGNGQMIHAPRTGKPVQISAVHGDMIFVRP